MKKYQFKLIDSTYAPQHARTVLLSLIEDKIKFLNHQIFSISERFGSNTEHLENRIRELREERSRLIDLLNGYREQADLIEISCSVDMKIHVSEPVV